MSVLYIVPNAYLHKLRRSLSQQDDSPLVMTMAGLVAQILKEGLVSYKEDVILEEVAIWQCVQDHREQLAVFQPIAHFPGFIQELRWLFDEIDGQEDIFEFMPQDAQSELRLLHDRYHQILRRHELLNAPGQMQRALELAKEGTVLPEVTVIKIQGLGELTPLEESFIGAVAQDRTVDVSWPEVSKSTIELHKASDPTAEVEMIGRALREQIECGVPVDKLGVAFPNPAQYLPILMPVFERLKIPWRLPSVSLRNTALGKTFLSLVAGELEGWHKHHLQLLTAPGWGFPFALTANEHRELSKAPPLKGLPAWRDRLGKYAGWERVLQLLSDTENHLVTRPLHHFGAWMLDLLEILQPEKWILPEDNLENWAELVKSWDGMQTIAQSFQEYEWESRPDQFLQLLQTLLDSYQIQSPRAFAERVQIMNVDQLGAYTYDKLYVGGLVEGQFPHYKHAHWLTKTATIIEREELYERITRVANNVYLHYPEVDRGGALNLPATILPKLKEQEEAVMVQPAHYPSLFLGKGFLQDAKLLDILHKNILDKGLSVSALNRYANCPYQFFCSHVLELEPLEEESFELEPWEHGNIIHAVLDQFWQEHLEGPLPELEKAQSRIEGLLHEEYAAIGSLPARRMIRSLRDFIRTDLQFVEGGFRPKYLEKRFQGLMIKTSLGSVEIKGRIDRIDLHSDGSYVVLDYKTGAAPRISAIVEGQDVQIAAYLLAAQNMLPQGRNVGAAYYLIRERARRGIFHDQYKQNLLLRKGPNVLEEDGFGEQQQKFGGILADLVERILQGKFPIEPINSRICSYCPYQGICRREVGY